MSEQALDLRRSLQIVRRHRKIVGIAAALGLIAGAVFTAFNPPMLVSEALVVLPSSTHNMATQVVIASSDPVLAGALRNINPAISPGALQGDVKARGLTSSILSITAQGRTAAEAEETANAVAGSFIAHVSSASSPVGQEQARVLELATSATGTPLPIDLLVTGGLGALIGALIGAIAALAIGRNDRRLRERDEIAGAIGVSVLASIPVGHPSDTAGWTKLLEDYDPGVVHAWRLRNALRQLGLTDPKGGSGASLAVVSLSSDPGALALGPQLAVFAANLGIRTALVVGPQQDANATATLRAACTGTLAEPSRRSGRLRVTVRDHEDADRQPDTALAVVVAVVDGQTPRVADTMRATVTVLGVSAGAATAEQLARVAVSAADDGRQIAGIFVADPDSTDQTTGRISQPARPAQWRLPTRLTDSTTQVRR